MRIDGGDGKSAINSYVRGGVKVGLLRATSVASLMGMPANTVSLEADEFVMTPVPIACDSDSESIAANSVLFDPNVVRCSESGAGALGC